MLVWVIKDGETPPIDPGTRKLRTALLADALVSRGHEVVWWASTFSHQRKRLLFNGDATLDLAPRYRLRLIAAGQYRWNVSLRRYAHHRRLARRFAHLARQSPKPDAIVCSYPVIDVAYEAVCYAREHAIPLVIDVRDYWPDLYLERIPRVLHGLAKLALRGDFRRGRYAMAHATRLVGISQGIVDWAVRYAGRPRCPNDRVFYTGYPDDPALLRKERIPRPGFLESHERRVVFAFVGSFGSSYDLETVLHAAARALREGHRNAHFVLAGDGDQARTLKRMARDLSNVRLTGWLGVGDIRSLLAHSDVGLVPCISMKDSMPNKIYEYLSAGLPLLSSLEGEAETLLAEHGVGFSYRCRDVSQLYANVLKLCEDASLRRQMSRRARMLFEEQFRAQDIYDTYATHVEDLAAPGARRRTAA